MDGQNTNSLNVKFKKAADALLNLLYPDSLYCICCGKIIDASRPYRLCNECLKDIKWAEERTCQKCGKLLSKNNPLDVCYSCREHQHVYDMGFTCCEYGMNPRSVLFALKYNGRADIGITLAEIMHDRMEQIRSETGLIYDAVLCVPMNEDKKKQRGYNQAEVMAMNFARLEGAPYYGNILRRVKNTIPLRGLTPAERKQVLSGVMTVSEEDIPQIAGKDLLLIDDIYTTGATVDAAAEVLMQAGAARVYIFTFAAGADVIKSE